MRTTLSSLILILTLGSGCDSGLSSPDVAGTYSGTALLPNAFSASATLTQQGRAVSGQMRISGVFGEALVQGEIDDQDRLAWRVQDGCEAWSGLLDIDSAMGEMFGSIVMDGSTCPVPTSASGTLRLTR